MGSFQILLVNIFSLISIAYGIFGVIVGHIYVGSKSYTGYVQKISKHEEAIRFYFWCIFFILLGVFCQFLLRHS